MKLTTAFLSTLALATLTSANFLDKNTPCGDTYECARDCQDGRYRIVVDVSRFRLVNFGCTLDPLPDPVHYSNPSCSFGLGDGPEETAKARETCDTVGGTLCRETYVMAPKFVNHCVMADKDSAAFEANCKAAGGTFRAANKGISYEILTRSCQKST